MAFLSYEMVIASNEEMARAHIWVVPSLRLVESVRSGSPTGSNAREQAAERYLKEFREDGETDFL